MGVERNASKNLIETLFKSLPSDKLAVQLTLESLPSATFAFKLPCENTNLLNDCMDTIAMGCESRGQSVNKTNDLLEVIVA